LKPKRIAALLLTVLPVAAAVCFYASAGVPSDQAPVAEVNGSPVTTKEFRRVLARQRAPVIDYFYKTHHAKYGRHFWEMDYNGENPEATVKEWAMKEIVRVKIELELAKQNGLIRETSHDDLLQEMEKENESRLSAVKAHQPVYGPIQMDEVTFMNDYMTKLRNALKEKLSKNELKATDEDLKQHYERVKDTMFVKEEQIRFQRISVSYKESRSHAPADQWKRWAKLQADSLKLLLDQGRDVQEAVHEAQKDSEGPVIRYSEEVWNNERAGFFFKSQPALYSIVAGDLPAGRASPVFDEAIQGEYVLIMITGRVASGYESLEEKADLVWRSYMDRAYDGYLDKLIHEARVNVNKGIYERIAIE
jgi:hypothetical protein